jgi:aldose 1-epimerase
MKSPVTKTPFGKLRSGGAVDLFTLTNKNGLIVKVTNYGATITEIHAPDREGKLVDVALGFDTLDGYLDANAYFGCTVGRYANRIALGRFNLDGKSYKLAKNDGVNSLHGGQRGFDKAVWKATVLKGAAVQFQHTSPDNDEGYPGKVDVTVVMTLTDRNELQIDYTATATKPTPINLTNHTYFNLAGSGDIKAHKLILASDFYLPKNQDNIPTGEVRSVVKTALDFTKPVPVGARFAKLGGKPLGYDHTFILRSGGRELAIAARVTDPKTGRVVELYTTEPALQFYTGNFLDGNTTGKGGVAYKQHSGFCLEAQRYPDSPNQPHFPNCILRPGETYRQTTVHRFTYV